MLQPLQDVIHSAGIVSAGLFSGSGVMELFIQQPARTAATPQIGLDQMQRVLARADPYMPLLAAGSFVISTWLAFMKPTSFFILTACLFGSIFPFSAILIKSVNKRIRAYPLSDAALPTAAWLVSRWGQLHAIRTGAGLLGFVTLVLSSYR